MRWDIGLNGKHVAYFSLNNSGQEHRLAPGDELRLSCNPTIHTFFEGSGHIRWVIDGEIALEMRPGGGSTAVQ